MILHELCYLAEYNHSDRFWRLLTQVMPHWKEVKTQLDSMAEFFKPVIQYNISLINNINFHHTSLNANGIINGNNDSHRR